MIKRECIIMSGISGSGKSTWIEKNVPNAWVVSADNFYICPDGSYQFQPNLLPEAHGECLRRFIESVRMGHETIVVDNTNLTSEEIAPYYAIAKAYEYDVTLVTLQCSLEVAVERNVHKVPIGSIRGQIERLAARNLPMYWDMTYS